MALLTSCLCCNLLLGAIISGIYTTMVYLAAFIVSVWWIVESKDGGKESENSVPAPAYLLCFGYLVVAAASAWMLIGLYKKRERALLVWVFLMTLFCFPEMGMVAFMTFVHWKITSPYGLADLVFYVFRAACNLLSVLCVQSQYATWRDAAATSHTLKRLEHLHMNSLSKNYGGESATMAYHNPTFLAGPETTPASPLPTSPYASLTRSPSRASQVSWGGAGRGEGQPAVSPPQPPPLQVRMGLPGWDPYTSRDSQSEFNAATFSPASVGFMPLVGGSGSARSEASLYPPPTAAALTVYHHTPQHLYPYHLPHLTPPALPDENFYYSTQSLDRRRYMRRGRAVNAGDGMNARAGLLAGTGVVGPVVGPVRESRSSLGAESDDLRKYRDVAL